MLLHLVTVSCQGTVRGFCMQLICKVKKMLSALFPQRLMHLQHLQRPLVCRCVLYEMVAGAPPYVAVNQMALAEKICGSPPPALPDTCPPSLQHLILSILQKEPSQRPSMLQCLNYVSSLPLQPGPSMPATQDRHHDVPCGYDASHSPR